MKVSNFKSKNLSISEHISLIDNIYSDSNRIFKTACNLNLTLLGKDNFYYSELYEEVELDIFKKLKETIVIKAGFLKEIINQGIIDYNIPCYIHVYKENGIVYIENSLTLERLEVDSRFILFNSLDKLTLDFNTELLNVNYLNLKTINNFSFFIISEKNSFYYLKRKNWRAIFIYNEIGID